MISQIDIDAFKEDQEIKAIHRLPRLHSWYHYTKSGNIDTSVNALEEIAFNFPACSDERVQILYAAGKLRKLPVNNQGRRWNGNT